MPRPYEPPVDSPHSLAEAYPLLAGARPIAGGTDLMVQITGEAVAKQLRERSINLYQRAAEYARGRGIIIADTKFEWGKLPGGDLILIDEVLTPDSSRFWPVDQYEVGKSFCDAVVAAGGIDALNAVWARPEALPTLAELEDPRAWIARTSGPRALLATGGDAL